MLASILGYQIARATFYRWLSNGLIPADKLVGHYRVKGSALRRFAEESQW
jgi:predicted site-specific integrase-resolvase